ncbi:hypothetical protein BDW66DRAFT_106882 [Aspergillus desertorum]
MEASSSVVQSQKVTPAKSNKTAQDEAIKKSSGSGRSGAQLDVRPGRSGRVKLSEEEGWGCGSLEYWEV